MGFVKHVFEFEQIWGRAKICPTPAGRCSERL